MHPVPTVVFPVGHRHVLDRRPALAALRVERHELVDGGRHLVAHGQAELGGVVVADGKVVGPAAVAEQRRQALRLVGPVGLEQELAHRVVHLVDRLARHVAHDERLVVAVGIGRVERGQDGDRRPEALGQAAELGIDRAEHGVAVHEDLVGGQRHERAARHGVVGHHHGDPAAVPLEGVGDLVGGQHEPAGRVQDQVDRHLVGSQADGAQHLLGVVDVDHAAEGDAEEPHRLLPVDHGHDARAARLLEAAKQAAPPPRAPPPHQHRQDQRHHDDGGHDRPEHVHLIVFVPQSTGAAPRCSTGRAGRAAALPARLVRMAGRRVARRRANGHAPSAAL